MLKYIATFALSLIIARAGFCQKSVSSKQATSPDIRFKKEFTLITDQVARLKPGSKKLMSPLGLCILYPGPGAYQQIRFSGVKKEDLTDESFISNILELNEGLAFAKTISDYAIPPLTTVKSIDLCAPQKPGSFLQNQPYSNIPTENGLTKETISRVKKLQSSISKTVLLAIKSPEYDEGFYTAQLGFSYIAGSWYLTLINFYECGS